MGYEKQGVLMPPLLGQAADSRVYGTVWYAHTPAMDIALDTTAFGYHELIFNHGDSFEVSGACHHGAVLFSPIRKHRFSTKVSGRYEAFGVILAPTQVFECFGVSVHDFYNEFAARNPFEGLLGTFHDALLSANNNVQKLSAFKQFFEQHFSPRNSPAIVKGFLKHVGQGDYKAVKLSASELGFSSKHLRATFKDIVGITPSAYVKLVRVNRALALMQQFPQRKLSEIGLACGFFDQAHFIRAFKAVAGMSPRQFKAQCHLQNYMYTNNFSAPMV